MSVKFHGRAVGFSTPPPRATTRAHRSPKTGDCKNAIIAAGGGCMDGNVNVVYLWVIGKMTAVPFLGHWTRFRMNGFTHYKGKDGIIRPIPKKQLHWTYQQWCNHHGRDIASLNMLVKRVGGRWQQALTWEQAVEIAIEHNTVITPELKAQAFKLPQVAAKIVDVCRAHDYPCWAMALLKMKFCRQKCAAVIGQGGHFSIIFGKFRKMARGTNKIRTWVIKPSQIWGPASARQWLRA
jgi:hypothetical protein